MTAQARTAGAYLPIVRAVTARLANHAEAANGVSPTPCDRSGSGARGVRGSRRERDGLSRLPGSRPGATATPSSIRRAQRPQDDVQLGPARAATGDRVAAERISTSRLLKPCHNVRYPEHSGPARQGTQQRTFSSNGVRVSHHLAQPASPARPRPRGQIDRSHRRRWWTRHASPRPRSRRSHARRHCGSRRLCAARSRSSW
jgi:hypothetical protein